jgi:hypothetical protein
MVEHNRTQLSRAYLEEEGGMRRNLDPVPVWAETEEEG